MAAKRVFLTTLVNLNARSTVDYYFCDENLESSTYTTAMSITEAGIKYIISNYDIDEIVVLGGKQSARNEEKHETKIHDTHIENIESIDSMSDYGFLCYRISEFLNQLDFEYADVTELINGDRKESIKNAIKDFKIGHNIAGDREIFYNLCANIELYKQFKKDVYNKFNSVEQKWIHHYLYSEMDSYYKMHIKESNKNASIRFIETENKDLLPIESITGIVREILNDENKEIDLHIDIQGLAPTDGNTLFSTFLMANRKVDYKCEIKGLINTKYSSEAFAGRITGAYNSYQTQKLIEAIDLFLDYGKDTALKEYWGTLEIKDESVEALFAAMDCIDEGIALCNIDLIVYGLRFIRQVVKKHIDKQTIDNVYLDYIINLLRVDYGDILSKDNIYPTDLLKWSLKKGFYQQVLTLIESKIPEDMVERGIYYYAKNQNDVDDFLQKINVLYWSEQQKMRWSFGDINHYYIKNYGRFAIDNRQKPEMISKDFARFKVDALKGNRSDVAKAYSNLDNDSLLYDLFYTYYMIGNLRNQVNHAVVLENDMDEGALINRKDFRDDIKVELIRFIGIYEKACNEVKNTDKPIVITGQQVKGYARNHELKILDSSSSDLVKNNTYTCEFNGKEVKIDIKLFENEAMAE